jgi:hypothetical protein
MLPIVQAAKSITSLIVDGILMVILKAQLSTRLYLSYLEMLKVKHAVIPLSEMEHGNFYQIALITLVVAM